MGALCTDVAQAIMMSFCSYITYSISVTHTYTHTVFIPILTCSFIKTLSHSSFFYWHLVSSCQPSKCSLSLSFAFSVLLGLPVNDDSLLLQCFDEILWCRCHCCSHTLIRVHICVCLFSFLSVMSPRLPDIGSMCNIKFSFNCKGCNIDGFDQYLCLL